MFVCDYLFLINFKPYLDGREEGWEPSLPEPPHGKGLSTATSLLWKTSPENKVSLMLGYIKLKDRSKEYSIKSSTNTALVPWRLIDSPKMLRIKTKNSQFPTRCCRDCKCKARAMSIHCTEKAVGMVCSEVFETVCIKAEANINIVIKMTKTGRQC